MDGLKQRIVGALVIVSLAVIFLPMVFDEPHQGTKQQIIPIPIQPQVPVIEIGSPVKPVYTFVESKSGDEEANETAIDSSASEQGSSKVAVAGTPSATVGKPEVDEDKGKDKDIVKSSAVVKSNDTASKTKGSTTSADKAVATTQQTSVFNKKALKNVWMIQLGTFGNHKNAYALRDSLRKQGYDGHTTKIEKDGKEFIRVFSGPYTDKNKAIGFKKKIDKQFKVKSLVVHFE